MFIFYFVYTKHQVLLICNENKDIYVANLMIQSVEVYFLLGINILRSWQDNWIHYWLILPFDKNSLLRDRSTKRNKRGGGGGYAVTAQCLWGMIDRQLLKGDVTHLKNIVGVLKRNKVIVTWNDNLWWQS